MNDGLIEGEADDDDPEVIAGMNRLAELRAAERSIIDVAPPKEPDTPGTGRPVAD